MLKGSLSYYLGNGQSHILQAGEVAIADQGQIHGAINEGNGDTIFVSIYSAPEIGYEKVVS